MSMSIHPKFQKLRLATSAPPVDPGGDPPAPKLFRGSYVKLEQWQIFSGAGFNTGELNSVFLELKNTPSLRGIKWAFTWGLIENVTTGPSTWDWSTIDMLIQRLWALRQGANPVKKRLMLAFGFMQGGTSLAAKKELMPPDLVDKVWTFMDTGSTTADGVYPKLWDPVVQSRILAFMTAMGQHIVPNTDGLPMDQSDLFCMMGTLESATRSPFNNYDGGSLAQYQNGIINTTGSSVIKSMKLGFPNTPVVFGSNYTRAFMQSAIPMCPTLKVGLNTPNCTAAKGLLTVTNPKGILLYYQDPVYINNILLTIEIQGQDYMCSIGIDGRVDPIALYDFPSYEFLYLLCKNTYNADYVIWQRTLPFWGGGVFSTNVPPATLPPGDTNPYTFPGSKPDVLTTFLQPYPALNADPTGGLGVGKPVPPNYL